MKKIFSILFALVLVVSLGLVTAAPVAAQSTVLDHFKCYPASGIDPIEEFVYLEDQFGTVEAVVGEAKFFCNPVAKREEEMPPMPSPMILNPDHHLTLYSLYQEEEPQERIVKAENQFGTQQLVVSDPVMLGVPTHKLYPGEHYSPVGLDHFLIYEVIEGPSVEVEMDLYDQFGYEPGVFVYEPVYFANPVKKTHDGDVTLIRNPDAHLVFYRIASYSVSGWVLIDNQFNEQELEVYVDEYYPALLAVPSEKEEQVIQYTLTISSTAGGSVTTPGEATFTCDAGTVVNLVATTATGYGFVNWAGDVNTIANVNAATTTITMEDDYKITARFTPVEGSKTQEVTNGTVNAREEADTQVEVAGTATVTVARYDENPGGPPPPALPSQPDWKSLGKYIDVYVPDTRDVTEVEIKLYYTNAEVTAANVSEKSLRLFWWDGEDWVACSDSGVNTDSTNGYSGYMWAKIRSDTTPTLNQLQGTEWGGYGHPSEPPQPLCSISTAAYGTDTAKEINILREFRDAVLLPNSLGIRFVSLYYKTSPPIANFISQHQVLKKVVRLGLIDPIVAILNWSHDLWSARRL